MLENNFREFRNEVHFILKSVVLKETGMALVREGLLSVLKRPPSLIQVIQEGCPLGMVVHASDTSTGSLRQEDHQSLRPA